MPTYYAHHFGPTLREKLEAWIESPHHEQVSLHEELALSRLAAENAVKLAAAAMESEQQETRALALECMQAAITEVKEMALACSKIEKDLEDKISVRALHSFIFQIMRVIAAVVDEDTAEKIREKIDTDVRVPRPGMLEEETNDGTASTPDQLVDQMDKTIGDSEDASC